MNDRGMPLDPDIAIAVLAAGSASRYGGGKLDARLIGRPVGRWPTRAAEAAGFVTRLLIVPPDQPAFAEHLDGWRTITNRHASAGLSSSIRVAAGAIETCSRLVIALADMPLVEPVHLRLLAESQGIVFTLYPEGSHGVPAAFPARCFNRLQSLPDATRPRAIDWGEEVIALPPRSARSLRDIDTSDDLATL